MLTALRLSRAQLAGVNWPAVGFYYVVACGLSYGLHFLPNLNPGFLPRHSIFTYGLGPIGAALLTRLLFRTGPPVTTIFGAKPGQTLLFVLTPLVLGALVGSRNRTGQNEHVYGLLVAVSGILYGFVEEAGWRGFLTDALRPLPTFWRVGLVALLWLGWHFTFLPDLSGVAGPHTPVWGVCAGFVLLSWGLNSAVRTTRSVLVAACLHETFNLTPTPGALILMLISWTVLLWTWNRSLNWRTKPFVTAPLVLGLVASACANHFF